MTVLYKLTSPLNMSGHNKIPTYWGENVTHELPIQSQYELCSKDVLHAYRSPSLAMIMDCIHGNYLPFAHLWECEGDVVADDGTKVGCTKLTTINKIIIPELSIDQKVIFAIKCAMHVYNEEKWTSWALAWLDGTNINIDAAAIAANAADNTTNAAFAAFCAGCAASYSIGSPAYAEMKVAYAAANTANAARDIGINTAFITQIANDVSNIFLENSKR